MNCGPLRDCKVHSREGKGGGAVTLINKVLDVRLKERDLLLSAKPASHLRDLILEIGSPPAILGHVNVKSLKHFCVIVISSTKIFALQSTPFWDLLGSYISTDVSTYEVSTGWVFLA